MADAVAAAAALLDGARRPLLRAVVRVEPARRIFVDRRARVVAGSLVAVATSFAAAVWQPLVALWLGAALFGVPHVVAGLRHVAVRERRAPATYALIAGAFLVGVVELVASGTRVADGAVRAYVVLFAAAIVVELAGGRDGTRARGDGAHTLAGGDGARAPGDRAGTLGGRLPLVVAAPLVVVAAAAGLVAPRVTVVVLAHLHGLGAVAWWARRARARGVPAWPFVVAVAVVMTAGALGALDRLFATTLWAPRSAAASIVAEAAGSTVGGAWLRRALFLYAFGQALHFAIWLRLVPEVDRDAPLPPPFRRALTRFEADFGRWARPLLVACVVAAPLLLVGGGAARESYFALGYFHVGLEGAALAARDRSRRA